MQEHNRGVELSIKGPDAGQGYTGRTASECKGGAG